MERICGNHGISKGMMYHYYSNKDELFLLCVERTFQGAQGPCGTGYGPSVRGGYGSRNKDFFMIRERFFQLHPSKSSFESAMLRPPKHLPRKFRPCAHRCGA